MMRGRRGAKKHDEEGGSPMRNASATRRDPKKRKEPNEEHLQDNPFGLGQ